VGADNQWKRVGKRYRWDVCFARRERIEREARGGEQSGDRTIYVCECGGVKRFIAYGVYPTSSAEAGAFISAFLRAFEYELWRPPGSPEWKKTWPKFVEVIAALEIHSTLNSFADELDVSIRTAQEIVKVATGGGNFRKYQVEKASRGNSRLSTKFRRRRR